MKKNKTFEGLKKLTAWIKKIEDNKLYAESMERIKNSKDEDLISMEDVVKEEGLDMKEIERIADKMSTIKSYRML